VFQLGKNYYFCAYGSSRTQQRRFPGQERTSDGQDSANESANLHPVDPSEPLRDATANYHTITLQNSRLDVNLGFFFYKFFSSDGRFFADAFDIFIWWQCDMIVLNW
jgi:hypothetical protein